MGGGGGKRGLLPDVVHSAFVKSKAISSIRSLEQEFDVFTDAEIHYNLHLRITRDEKEICISTLQLHVVNVGVTTLR